MEERTKQVVMICITLVAIIVIITGAFLQSKKNTTDYQKAKLMQQEPNCSVSTGVWIDPDC